MATSHELHLRLLVEALQLVASDADVQVASLPNFVHVPDEIALTYWEAYQLTDELESKRVITPDLKAEMNRLNAHFDAMSLDKSLWTLDQLAMSPKWEETRVLARSILKRMGLSLR
jgi:hypothetical protein